MRKFPISVPEKFKTKFSSNLVSAFIVVLLILVLFSCGGEEKKSEIKKVPEPQEPQKNEYGLVVDSLIEHSGVVLKHQNFSDILLPFGVSYKQIIELEKLSKPKFDMRKIRPQHFYAAYVTKDSLNKLQYFVYEIDNINFVIYDFSDSLLSVRLGKKEITTRERKVGGIVKNSLWLTMEEIGVSPVLAIRMSEILAWQIDFNAVRNGDRFKVIYEENFVAGDYAGVGVIQAVMFEHMGEKYYGFRFKQGDDIDYYDENGGSLRKEFLKAPLKFTRVSSRFSYRRYHPILHRYRAHLGIDFAAPIGTPIHAVGDGVVIEKRRKRAEGNYLRIRHNSTYTSGYMHLSRFARGIKVGKRVRQGEIVGYVGSTGLSTGPHLDFRFWKNGKPVNYLALKFPPSKPVKKEYMKRFEAVRDSLMKELDAIPYFNEFGNIED